MRYRIRIELLAIGLSVFAGCADPEGATDASALDVGESSLDASEVLDGRVIDAYLGDAGVTDAALGDAGSLDPDVGPPDAGAPDAGAPDAGPPDAGAPDAGAPDAGPPDAGRPDAAAPADPCSPLPAGLTTWTRSDSASSGTPDSYTLAVTPGDPFCASITGGGGGTWWVNVSNGTSSGVYCRDEPTCSILVPAGQTALMVTAVTDDIGYYTLTVRYRPR